ncbi:hypothetical protein GTY40_21795 [Streptomyces sp. SID8359]|uniref:hypothetical protein n=1 Tax=unclassified Streptomyces TaxID=2593676 RepID=UPI00136B9D6C|nr:MULTISPECIES: hypothetical protein [unclassified Streptomyces]MYT93664.1 hypothetical protein [Streptomyces sp. SID8359]
MLRAALKAAGSPLAGELVAGMTVNSETLRGWVARKGGPSPELGVPSPEQERDFWSLVRKLRRASRYPTHSEAEWEAALRAAQSEAKRARGESTDADRRGLHSGARFVRPHRSAPETSAAEVQGREAERAEMNAFVRNSRADAPSYLCWYADAPVGKTTLLADYVRRPPKGVDILNFFVSAPHGTDTRAEFEREIVEQADGFLGRSPSAAPRNVRGWKALYIQAATMSARHGRRLLLVVDGLDDDLAWSGTPAGSGTPDAAVGTSTSRRPLGTGTSPTGGSIAALLPARPPENMRIIASLRRRAPLPDDVPPVRHPLREGRHLRTLVPVPGVASVRRPMPSVDAFGGSVEGLLAVAGGGLGARDLAELAGLPAEFLDRLAQGPVGRALVIDEPVSRTYALADSRLVHAVREDLGEAGVRKHVRELLAWARGWHDLGWPENTPPYPLAHQLRLLTGTAERAAYVFDMARLRRLADTAGPEAALTQLDDFQEESESGSGVAAAATPDSDLLAMLVPLHAARSVLCQDIREDLPGAASLFVRLGDVERARGLARSAASAVGRAVQLADVAVEMAYVKRVYLDVDAVVREAAEWLLRDRVEAGFPGILRNPDAQERLLGATGTLAKLRGPGTARPLLRSLLQDPAAGTETLIRAAGMPYLKDDEELIDLLIERAETLEAGGMRARAAAVDLWGALARATGFLGPRAGQHIEAVCDDLGDAEGLEVVNVLATAASALCTLHHKRCTPARRLMRDALARMWKVVEASGVPDHRPGSLSSPPLQPSSSEDDRTHRFPSDLDGTLARLVKAAADAGVSADLVEVRRLKDTVSEAMCLASIVNAPLERTRLALETAEADPARQVSSSGKASAGTQSLPPSKQRTTHHRSTAPPSPVPSLHTDQPHPSLVAEAEDRRARGDHQGSRELLEAALRNRPVLQSSRLAKQWTTDLCQALGVVGETTEAEAFTRNLPDTRDRARHLAALSLGCSFAGDDTSAARYAQEAARLVPAAAAPELANSIAQALAHSGDGAAASSMVAGGSAARKRQALTAVAAGLVRPSPEGAARVAERVLEALVRGMEGGRQGSLLNLLPELAALLLAFPDVRRPDPRLSEALHRAALHLADPALPRPVQSTALFALLARSGLLPDEDACVIANAADRWRSSSPSGEEHSAELILLAAVEGDTVAVRRHADLTGSGASNARLGGLRAAAAHLAGVRVGLATDSRADDRVLRTCLALVQASGRVIPDEMTARYIARELLRSEAWTFTIPLLPPLAPRALGRLCGIAVDMTRHLGGADVEEGAGGLR